MRRRRLGRLNRPLLLVLGLLLLVAAALGTVLALGAWPGVPPGSALLGPADGVLALSWFPVALLGGGLLLGVLALVWLLAQLPWASRSTTFRLHTDPARGTTGCAPEVLARAVREQLLELPGVHAADVEVSGSALRPSLAVQLTLNERADVGAVVRTVSQRVVADLSGALEVPVVELAGRVDATAAVRSASSVEIGRTDRADTAMHPSRTDGTPTS